MKLQESSVKRKWENEHTERNCKSRKTIWNPKISCDIDVLQARIRSTTKSNQVNSERLRIRHAVTYPVNCDPVDGITPNSYVMQVRSTSCSRCLQGEAGHFRHIIEK